MAKTITFVCLDCQETFEEPVQAFVDDTRSTVVAPLLCKDCGHGAED